MKTLRGVCLTVLVAIAAFWACEAKSFAESSGTAPLTYPQQRLLEDLRFRHAMGESILEKLLIAGLILALGLWTSQRLERFKAREAYLTAFTQHHVESTAQVWQLIYQWEAHIQGTQTLLELQSDDPSRIERSVARSRSFASDLRKIVWEQRYWLGADLYCRFVVYHNALHRYLDLVLLGEQVAAGNAKRYLDRLKQDIMVTLDSDLLPSRATVSRGADAMRA